MNLFKTIPRVLWMPILLVLLSFYFDFLFLVEINERLKIIFPMIDFQWSRYLILKLVLSLGLFPLLLKRDWKYQLVLSVSSLFFLIPNVTYAAYYTLPIWFVFGMSVFNWLLIIPIKIPRTLSIEWRSEKPSIAFLLLALLSVFAVIFLYFDTNSNFNVRHFLLQNDIYEARSNTAQNISTLGKYVMSWTVNLLLPLTLIFSWNYRKIWVVLPVFLGLFLFGFNPHKTILFNLLMVALFAIFQGFKTNAKWIFIGFVVLLILGRAEALISKDHVPLIEGFMVRRLLFLPAYLNQCYLEYFQEPIYLSHSILKSFSDVPFSGEPSVTIGEMAYPGSGTHANNGIFSDGYMNFGRMGFWLWTILAGLIIAFMLSAPFRPEFVVFIILVINTFKSSPFLTSLKNHGVLAVFLIFLFIHLIKSNSDSTAKNHG